MFLKHMRPDQVQAAIAAKTPLLLPAGVIECHGSQAALGLDTMAAEEWTDLPERLEQRGPTSTTR